MAISIKQAIERKFPRYTRSGATVFRSKRDGARGFAIVACFEDIYSANDLIQERNELIDKLIEASELLAEAQGALLA